MEASRLEHRYSEWSRCSGNIRMKGKPLGSCEALGLLVLGRPSERIIAHPRFFVNIFGSSHGSRFPKCEIQSAKFRSMTEFMTALVNAREPSNRTLRSPRLATLQSKFADLASIEHNCNSNYRRLARNIQAHATKTVCVQSHGINGILGCTGCTVGVEKSLLYFTFTLFRLLFLRQSPIKFPHYHLG